MPNLDVYNVFECGRNNPDVSYGRAYFTDMLDHQNEYNDRHSQRLSGKNIKESVLQVMEEEEEEVKHNINNITCDTSFQSPITMNIQKKYVNTSLERRLASGVLEEMVETFK